MCDSDTDKNHLLLNNLKIFVDEQKTWLRNTLESVGWNISDLETLAQRDEPKLVPCSINPEHRVPQESLLNHEDRCWKKHGDYPKITDVPNLEVIIGSAGIVNYFHGLLISFLFDTRRYADLKDSANSAKDCDNDSNDNLDTNDKTEKNRNEEKDKLSTCLMELLAAERDAKRRRAAYRGKRVHSNKKSYNEVIREVISSQMQTLNDASNLETESEIIDTESVQKPIIQPRADSYLGVGSNCFNGNPFKRWMSIEEEERELIKEIQSNEHEKNSDYDRRRDRSREKNKNFEKSAHSHSHYRQHREKFRDGDRYHDVNKLGDNREYHSSRSNERKYFSNYDEEKHWKKKDVGEHLEKKLEGDHSDIHESSDRRKKKREKRSRDRSSEHLEKKHENYHSDSHKSSDRHKKTREKRSRDRSNDSHDLADRRKKKSKKKSRERSIHKKKHRKSKHRDSKSESN